MRRLIHGAGWAAFLLVSSVMGCGDLPEDAVGKTSSPIVNGLEVSASEPGAASMVAIYHRLADDSGGPGPWFTRPCSGMIVAQQGNEAVVITARHCVTVDGKVDSATAPLSWFKVAVGMTPGYANPNPPSGSKNLIYIETMPTTTQADFTRDAALLWVYAPTWASRADRKGVAVAPIGPDRSFTAYGYGMNYRDDQCYNANPDYYLTTGVLRRGELVTLSSSWSGLGGSYRFNYTPTGYSVTCGDSGGPDLGYIAPDMQWLSFLGEHTQDSPFAFTGDSAVPGAWMSQTLGGFYLSPMSSPDSNLNRRSDNMMQLEASTSGTPLSYDPLAKTISQKTSTGVDCLDWSTSLNSFVLHSCSSPSKLWEITADGKIRNAASGMCMRHSATTIANLRTCPTASATVAERARFTWIWHPMK